MPHPKESSMLKVKWNIKTFVIKSTDLLFESKSFAAQVANKFFEAGVQLTMDNETCSQTACKTRHITVY